MSRRTRIGYIPTSTLMELIDLPEGWRLIGANGSWDPPGLQVVVEADEFEEVPDNAESPRVMLHGEFLAMEGKPHGRIKVVSE